MHIIGLVANAYIMPHSCSVQLQKVILNCVHKLNCLSEVKDATILCAFNCSTIDWQRQLLLSYLLTLVLDCYFITIDYDVLKMLK